jgi:hypothetical protein
MQKLEHPNVIKLYETYEHKGQLHMVMELCTGGNLYSQIYDENKARDVVAKISRAVAYCHGQNVAHRVRRNYTCGDLIFAPLLTSAWLHFFPFLPFPHAGSQVWERSFWNKGARFPHQIDWFWFQHEIRWWAVNVTVCRNNLQYGPRSFMWKDIYKCMRRLVNWCHSLYAFKRKFFHPLRRRRWRWDS